MPPLQTDSKLQCQTIQLINICMQSRKGWSQLEDDRLIKIIKKYGMKNWTLVSEKLSLGTTTERTGKQCRERWHNHLNPDINHDAWTKRDDEMLFDAHRMHGSKWKEISKLFKGRTDNSIKNHFYSTVRRCLRRISKLAGGLQTTITMKSVKPFVLSKIVENTELTTLILKIGRDKTRGRAGDAVELDANTVARVSAELKRISAEYEEKQLGTLELKKSPSSPSRRSIQSLSSEKNLPQLQPTPVKTEVKRLRPEDETLRCYFEEEQGKHHHDREELILETQQESKQRHEGGFQGGFRYFEQGSHVKGAETAEKEEKEKEDEYWIEQEESHSFFNSPSCRKNKFPDVRLLAKISRNSQSPGCSLGEERISSALKASWNREEKMEISFDPRELFGGNFGEGKEQNDQQ